MLARLRTTYNRFWELSIAWLDATTISRTLKNELASYHIDLVSFTPWSDDKGTSAIQNSIKATLDVIDARGLTVTEQRFTAIVLSIINPRKVMAIHWWQLEIERLWREHYHKDVPYRGPGFPPKTLVTHDEYKRII